MTGSPDSLPACVDHIFRSRRSTRQFRPDPVSAETMRAIFELASTAPSASNTQPWLVEVVSGATRDKLSQELLASAEKGLTTRDFDHDDTMYSEEHLSRRRETGALVYQALGIDRGDKAARWDQYLSNLRFFGAPHVAFMFVPTKADMLMCSDVGMYTQTLLLAMTAHGVSSCAQAIVARYADTVREVLGVADRKLLYCVSFGYADEDAAINKIRTSRAPIDNLVHFQD